MRKQRENSGQETELLREFFLPIPVAMKGGLKWLIAQIIHNVVVHLDPVLEKYRVKWAIFSVKMKRGRNKFIKSLLLFHKAQDNKRAARLYDRRLLFYNTSYKTTDP